MKKTPAYRQSHTDSIMASTPLVLFVAVASIILGIFFIVSQNENKPIPRSEAVSYSGEFEEYEVWRNYKIIHFKDGTSYDVYPHTETIDFQNMMKSLKKGTKLYLLVNPNNDYVVEIKTESKELLNFETSQKEIDSYDNGYIALGIALCIGAAYLILYVIFSSRYKRKEKDKHINKAKKRIKNQNDGAIRYADYSVRSKTLLEADVAGYKICYRRVKHVNELVVNGLVYDEKKGIIEFTHKLCAVIDNHTIEAGYNDNDYSYIMFDGEPVAEKKRFI